MTSPCTRLISTESLASVRPLGSIMSGADPPADVGCQSANNSFTPIRALPWGLKLTSNHFNDASSFSPTPHLLLNTCTTQLPVPTHRLRAVSGSIRGRSVPPMVLLGPFGGSLTDDRSDPASIKKPLPSENPETKSRAIHTPIEKNTRRLRGGHFL